MNRPIDIRNEFAAFVRACGGVVSDDVYQEFEQPKNADFIFTSIK